MARSLCAHWVDCEHEDRAHKQFNGVAPDDIDVTVEFVNDATGEALDTGSYQDMRENHGQ